MASTITQAEFDEALSRYPEVLERVVKKPKPGSVPLEELDQFRYVEAPARFSPNTSEEMGVEDVKKLVDWKLRHGTYRPTLPGLVASNSTKQVQDAIKDAFDHYTDSPSDIKTVIDKLAKPLKGIGPATASLLLAIHDPDEIIFFSDEAYRWLCADGKKTALKYSINEYESLLAKAKALMGRLDVSAIDIEKAAYVLVKENQPVFEPAAKKESSGLPRGRPRKPDSERKAVAPTVPGRGRGRPPKVEKPVAQTTKSPTTGKRGQPKKTTLEGEDEVGEAAREGPQSTPAGKRGRPKKVNSVAAATPAGGEMRGRGRPTKAKPNQDDSEESTIATGGEKRKAEDDADSDRDDKRARV